MNQHKKNSMLNAGQEAKQKNIGSGKGLKETALRVKDRLAQDHVSIVAAGVAFYFFMALIPTLAAVISIYGLVMDPAEVEQQIAQISGVLPEQASSLIGDILKGISAEPDTSLGWSLIISILLSVWSANKGTSAVFEGVNIAYNVIDQRNFFKKYAITLLFTLSGVITGFLCIAFVVGFPALVKSVSLPSTIETAIQWTRWPLMAAIVMGALSLIYKVAPDRKNVKFKWINPGALIATLLWIVGSLLFTLYMDNFGSYGETYGSFAAIIILMLWFYLTAYLILLGAELNSEIENSGTSENIMDNNEYKNAPDISSSNEGRTEKYVQENH